MPQISRISPLDELRKAAQLNGPRMPVPPEDASANADLLRQSPVLSNVGNVPFFGPGAGGPATITPGVRADSYSAPVQGMGPHDEALNGLLAARMGAGSDVVASRQAADEKRMQAETDQQIADRGLEDGSDQARQVAQAGIKNTVGGILSEGAAANSFGPMATQAGDLANARKLAEIRAQYGGPAEARSAGDLAVANVNAQGHVQTAGERKLTQQEVVQKAIADYLTKWGSDATPEGIALIRKELGGSDTSSPAVTGLNTAARGINLPGGGAR